MDERSAPKSKNTSLPKFFRVLYFGRSAGTLRKPLPAATNLHGKSAERVMPIRLHAWTLGGVEGCRNEASGCDKRSRP